MAEKRRQALLLQKYEEPAGAVHEYLWFHDKAKKGYKGKVVTESMRKVAADQLIFTENGKLKKTLPIAPHTCWDFTFALGVQQSKMLFSFHGIASRAKSAFENLKKNDTKEQNNLRNSKKSGTPREAVEKTESELREWSFLTWLDDFVQPRASRSSFYVDDSYQSH